MNGTELTPLENGQKKRVDFLMESSRLFIEEKPFGFSFPLKSR